MFLGAKTTPEQPQNNPRTLCHHILDQFLAELFAENRQKTTPVSQIIPNVAPIPTITPKSTSENRRKKTHFFQRSSGRVPPQNNPRTLCHHILDQYLAELFAENRRKTTPVSQIIPNGAPIPTITPKSTAENRGEKTHFFQKVVRQGSIMSFLKKVCFFSPIFCRRFGCYCGNWSTIRYNLTHRGGFSAVFSKKFGQILVQNVVTKCSGVVLGLFWGCFCT